MVKFGLTKERAHGQAYRDAGHRYITWVVEVTGGVHPQVIEELDAVAEHVEQARGTPARLFKNYWLRTLVFTIFKSYAYNLLCAIDLLKKPRQSRSLSALVAGNNVRFDVAGHVQDALYYG